MPNRLARRFRITFLYVSWVGKTDVYAAMAMKSVHHCVHLQANQLASLQKATGVSYLQPLYCAAKPPMTGPSAGPRNGAMMKNEDAMARRRGG